MAWNRSPDTLARVSEPIATVVVPARNEEDAISACLDSVLAQDETRLQVVVVDGASSDRTPDIVKSYAERDARVEILYNPRQIIPVSLNLALDAARAPWLVRVDAHAVVPTDYVRRAVAHLETGRWGAVGGRKDGVGRTPAGKAIAAAMASPFGVGNSTYHYGTAPTEVDHVPFGAYPVAVVKELGGWNEDLRVNQDFELDYRLRASGRAILFDPELHIDWDCRQSIRELFRQYRRYGRGKAKVAALHPRSAAPRHLAAPCFVAWLVIALVTGLRRPRSAAVAVMPYGVALAVASARSARSLPPEARRWVPAAFAAMHIGWGLGFWEGIFDTARNAMRRTV